MSRKLLSGQERHTPVTDSGRSTPEVGRRRHPPEDGMYVLTVVAWLVQDILLIIASEVKHKDKSYRRYAAGIERALALNDNAQQEWADYISFLGRLHKVLRTSTDYCKDLQLYRQSKHTQKVQLRTCRIVP